MRVVVTGGAGFIGGNLCRTLVDTGAVSVTALDDLSTGLRSNLTGTGAVLVVGSILDRALLDETFAGAVAVVHLAARPSVPRSLEDPLATHEVNATGTILVLEAARRADVRHVIVASSSSVYGASPVLPKHEELPAKPMSPYAASKLATESYALSYAHSFGLNVLALRFFNVFGPLQSAGHAYAAVIPAFVAAALAGQALTMYGDGHQTRDFTYVGTVTAAIGMALRQRVSYPGPVNLAFGTRTSLVDLVNLLERLLGSPLDIVHAPGRVGDARDSQAEVSRLRSLLPGIEPVALEEGLLATVAWQRSQITNLG